MTKPVDDGKVETQRSFLPPLGDRTHHLETSEIVAEMRAPDYQRGNVERHLHLLTSGERYKLYRAVMNLIDRKRAAKATPVGAPEERQQDAEKIALRKRIHQLEGHNQWFERCESGWCNPDDNCNPALGIFGPPVTRKETP